jgi:signal transduction histidine kinase
VTYKTSRSGDARASADFSAAGSFERYVEHIPAAFAVTHGDRHTLVYANAAFRNLVANERDLTVGRPVADVFATRDTAGLTALLDRAFRTGVVSRDRRIELVDENALLLSCTIWPDVNNNGQSEHLVIELRVATQGELTLGLQREVAERLLLSALREQDAADVAEVARRGASFLAAESRRLGESLDETETLEAIAGMSLPTLGAWCIVDTLDDGDKMHRLAILHPDPAKQALLRELEGRWIPEPNEGFGLPAALRNSGPSVVATEFDAALGAAAHNPEISRVLQEVGIGPLLTVPLVIRTRLVGAVTFVGGRRGKPFTSEDVELAEDLAGRSAMALERARLYGEAIALKARAEAASLARGAFLGMMSHELRTPLNAIGGYVDLIDMEIHGPVTAAQHVDLARIRSNQRYLMGLINDVLNFTKLGSGHLVYDIADIRAHAVLAASVALVEPLIVQKQLIYDGITCDPKMRLRGDQERVIQILVNLLSNAIKFTPPGGRLVIDCEATEKAVRMRVCDTGIGIPPDKLEAIFEPFIQIKGGLTGPESGIGLGLAISRLLARAMHGDLTAESALGEGARFTLTLPLSTAAPR